jgi:hypothetical protein
LGADPEYPDRLCILKIASTYSWQLLQQTFTASTYWSEKVLAIGW